MPDSVAQSAQSIHFVQVTDLVKRYGDLIAVDGISFSIAKGEIFGLLGPNGAGKTTTLEIMEGLRPADGGQVTIAGLELPRAFDRLKQRIGVQLQLTSLYAQIKVGEAIALFASYYEKSLPVDALLELVSLVDKRDAKVKTLSGGQNQRLAIALALVNDPDLVFLDEPTTGLDPQARQNLWAIIEGMKSEGRTVILTTHYMEEAERLADRVAIVDHGKIIAIDTADALIRNLGVAGQITCTPSRPLDRSAVAALAADGKVDYSDQRLTIEAPDPQTTLRGLLELAAQSGVSLEHLSLKNANLEDVFLHLTGHHLRE